MPRSAPLQDFALRGILLFDSQHSRCYTYFMTFWIAVIIATLLTAGYAVNEIMVVSKKLLRRNPLLKVIVIKHANLPWYLK